MKSLTRSLTIGMLCYLMLAACAPAATLTPTMASSGQVEVNVEGQKIGFECQGEGDLTIIFEAGFGMPGLIDEGTSEAIKAIHLSSLEPIRTCRYSRVGLEGSTQTSILQNSKSMVDNLHTLIQNANIPGPYILIGHSFGGMVVRHYQMTYPENVAGLVLIESIHIDTGRMDTAMNDAALNYPTPNPTEEAEAALYSEQINWDGCFSQWQSLGSLGDLPLVVVTSDKPKWVEEPLPADTVWWELQDELASLSTHSVHLHTSAGHNIPLEDPAMVVAALEELVKMIQAAP